MATASPAVAPAGVTVKVETDQPNSEVLAGEKMSMKVTVTNGGSQTLYRLYAATKSDDPLFDNKELVFGKLEPGKARTAMVPLGWCDIEGHKAGSTAVLPKDAPRVCKVPKDSLTRADGIKVQFQEARGHAPADAEVHATVTALEKPVFAYGYQIADNLNGNGDGRVQKGESVTMYVTVKNVGKGRSFETQANLRNLSGDGVLLHEGRFDISDMMPGDTKKVVFTYDVTNQLEGNEAKVELSISDTDLRESVVDKVRMPIMPQASLAAASGSMRAKASGAGIYESADATSRMFGRLPAGTAVTEMATSADFVKVALGGNRFGFVRASELDAGGGASGGAGSVAFEDALAHAPPTIEIGQAVLVTRDSHVMLKGLASDTDRLLDAYIFVGARKLFYQSNRTGADPKKMAISADLPLRPGVNVVTVMARENPDTTRAGKPSSCVATDRTASCSPPRRPMTSCRKTARLPTTERRSGDRLDEKTVRRRGAIAPRSRSRGRPSPCPARPCFERLGDEGVTDADLEDLRDVRRGRCRGCSGLNRGPR